MMATDDHGLGIPVPDEHTQDYEFYALFRDAVDVIARHLTALKDTPAPAPAPEPMPAPAVPAEVLERLERLETALAGLTQKPVPETWQRAIDDARLATAEARHTVKTLTDRTN